MITRLGILPTMSRRTWLRMQRLTRDGNCRSVQLVDVMSRKRDCGGCDGSAYLDKNTAA